MSTREEEVLKDIIILPYNISLETFKKYPNEVTYAWHLWNIWVYITVTLQHINTEGNSPTTYLSTIVIDEFQASVFNSITGFYRVAFSALRNILEQMVVAVYYEPCLRVDKFVPNNYKEWLKGKEKIFFNEMLKKISDYEEVKKIEADLLRKCDDKIFKAQKDSKPCVYLQRLYSTLCKYTHGRPNYTNNDLCSNNSGPWFNNSSFKTWYEIFLKIYLLFILVIKITKQNIDQIDFLPKNGKIKDIK
ncbi:MAG: hypothetical protein HYU63_05065 [Armatimonadetes bacterium]|nr:hypothetical protein [Armatimonadota bacterium]